MVTLVVCGACWPPASHPSPSPSTGPRPGRSTASTGTRWVHAIPVPYSRHTATPLCSKLLRFPDPVSPFRRTKYFYVYLITYIRNEPVYRYFTQTFCTASDKGSNTIYCIVIILRYQPIEMCHLGPWRKCVTRFFVSSFLFFKTPQRLWQMKISPRSWN